MLEAIQDGTLEPGERLNDDQLTAWLGVSRTPVREAIARLASEGLIEMAANRYTRVASQSTDAFREAADPADALYSHALVRADQLPAAPRRTLQNRAEALRDRLQDEDVDAYRELQDVLGDLTAALGNGLMAETEHAPPGSRSGSRRQSTAPNGPFRSRTSSLRRFRATSRTWVPAAPIAGSLSATGWIHRTATQSITTGRRRSGRPASSRSRCTTFVTSTPPASSPPGVMS